MSWSSVAGPLTTYDVTSAVGPQSDYLSQGFTDGSNPPARQSERVLTCFVDGYQFNNITNTAQNKWRYAKASASDPPEQQFKSATAENFNNSGISYDQVLRDQSPPFEEWATAQVGTVAVQSKTRGNYYRNSMVAQTASPVLVCAQKMGTFDNADFTFAGVVRTKSVRQIDDGRGPKQDEYFTLCIAGVMEMLNNSNHPIEVGQLVEWTFFDDDAADASIAPPLPMRQKLGPRVIVVRAAKASNARVFGRALRGAMPGQRFDVHIGPF